ncbi:hypothetical protein AQUSIP_18760 [Aquicella siphonis]|uniref:Outer membrane protein OmpA-like transmembrane domain-containing protein n=1 Tax=Aquicella siphonis TaxID=254247 RepID=A0A5E4PHQ4_9COXI|nr:outer membrane beta-barrel protein [Aquicella siphonis]VVC76560.1 hypothetical protein AQUSIP_18760 [Aquicella siphonis]
MADWKQMAAAAIMSGALLMSGTQSHAAQPGLYLGGQLGWGNVTESGVSRGDMGQMINEALGYGNFTVTNFKGTTDETGFAWRVFGGYQIGYHWAAEIGWTLFPRLPIDAYASGDDHTTGLPYQAGTSGTFKTSAFDLVGKYIYPLPCCFNLYGKLGLAYLTGRSNMSVNVSETGLVATADDSDITNRLYPTGGIGLGYDFRPDISMDLSYTRIQRVGNSHQLGSMDLVLLAMALHFG